MDSVDVVKAFWQAMQTNDFSKASEWLDDGFVCEWPQSSELIKGRDNFVAINKNYPANGTWQFEIQEIVGSGNRVVSDVCITDGKVHARAITFHTVENGLIARQKEFWPDEYEAPSWRSGWVEILKP